MKTKGSILFTILVITFTVLFAACSPSQQTLYDSRAQGDADTAVTQTALALSATITSTLPPTSTPVPTPQPYKWTLVTDTQIIKKDFVQALAIHPLNADIIYAGTRSSGVYKSVDGGVSWIPASSGITEGDIQQIIIDSQDPETVYVSVSSFGVFKTEDGGKIWRCLETDSADREGPNWEVSYLAMNPIDPGHLIYTNGTTISMSKDHGEMWERMEIPFSDPGLVGIDPISGNLIAAVGEEWSKGPMKIYLWDTKSSNWQLVQEYYPTYNIMYEYLEYDQIRNKILLSLGYDDMQSVDGGWTWVGGDLGGGNLAISSQGTYMDAGWGLPNIRFYGKGPGFVITNTTTMPISIDVAPNNSQRIVVGCERGMSGGSIWVSNNGGVAWDKRENGLGAVEANFGFDPERPLIYISQYSVPIFPRDNNPRGFADFYSYDLTDNSFLAIDTAGCGSHPSQPWEKAACGLIYDDSNPDPEIPWDLVWDFIEANNVRLRNAVRDPQDLQSIYLATDIGVYLSLDSGENWHVINDGLMGTPIVYNLAFNPQNPNDLYALTPFGFFKLEYQ